jgi:hypothetical protein
MWLMPSQPFTQKMLDFPAIMQYISAVFIKTAGNLF